METNASKAFPDQSASNDTTEPFQVYKYYFMRQIFAAVVITAAIVGLVGNCMVIAAVPLSKKLHTVTNVFVVNLSVSDLTSCLFLPLQALVVLSEDGWPFPKTIWLCNVIATVLLVASNCSINNLSLIALNRWIGITKSSATTQRIFSRRNMVVMVIITWALPFCIAFVLPANGIGGIGYEPLYSTCSWIKDHPLSFTQNIIAAIVNFPLQLTIITCGYIAIFRYVLKTSRRMAQHNTRSISGELSAADHTMRKKMWKRQVAVTKNMVYIVLAYVICLAPFFLAVIPLGYDWSIRMTPYTAAIMYINSCMNPVIYATSHPDFKEAFAYMVRCQFKAIPQSKAHSKKVQKK